MTYKSIIISSFLLILIGLATFFTLSYHQKNLIVSQKNGQPDAIMEDVTATIMDKQGKITMKMITPHLLYFTDNDETRFTKPKLIIYRKSSPYWYITAMDAKAVQKLDQIDFWNNVNIHHAASENNPA